MIIQYYIALYKIFPARFCRDSFFNSFSVKIRTSKSNVFKGYIFTTRSSEKIEINVILPSGVFHVITIFETNNGNS